ncbi:hypothetical protein [Roseovarius aestuariivivens]|uniref:hypothetical protein n=1 Tax=Roseovarius aestuariivivens TaxID=1888910 RepID=UPI00108201BE|nr:hypothetical protein [Roseovarius aestuariivivens]
MKRLLLHIGPHKTASTYLQANMVVNDEVLRSGGVWYPDVLRVGPGHQRAVHTLKAAETAPLDALRDAATDFETMVLSAENFTKLNPREIGRLADVFGDWDIQILFYYRGCHELWPSHWQETIKQGAFDIWPHYLMAVMGFTEKGTLGFVNPETVLGHWAQVFGSERLHLYPYAAIGEDPRDALRPVCQLVGLDPDELRVEEKGRNASYPPERIEALRVLNLRAALRGQKPDSRLRRAYMKNVEAIEKSQAFKDLEAHCADHARTSVLRPQRGYLAHLEDAVEATYGARFMAPLPKKSALRSKTILYLDPSFPVPDQTVEELENMI